MKEVCMEPAKGKALAAVDLGAQSCRVSLLRWIAGGPRIQVVHRFANAPRQTATGLKWDVEAIFQGIAHGLRVAASEAHEGIASIGIDGWAVDYVRLRESGELFEDAYCYRDVRTEAAEKKVHELVSPARLYAFTGIQILRINTLYQLYADKLAAESAGLRWMNLPEYMSFRLGGERVAEYTNATHTALVALGTRQWSAQIFTETDLDIATSPPIVPSGTAIGTMQGDLATIAELRGTRIIVPACHDTASAISAIPAAGDDWAFISSGTWSLVGTVLSAPCVTSDAYDQNFTNLGGVGGFFYFLKNVHGMWLLQQCIEEWESSGASVQISELLSSCEKLGEPDALVDLDDPALMAPGEMIAKFNAQRKRMGRSQLSADRREARSVANLIFHSLAEKYAEVLSSVGRITGKKLKRLFIVGGGSQNALLNRLTGQRTGLEVIQGSSECTTVGNFAVQLAALQGDWNETDGVSAASVSGWSERLLANAVLPAFAEK
jgi:rhamnulokinase